MGLGLLTLGAMLMLLVLVWMGWVLKLGAAALRELEEIRRQLTRGDTGPRQWPAAKEL